MSAHLHPQTVPRGALLGAAAMILLSFGLAAAARRNHLAHPEAGSAPAQQAIEVRFEDRAGGDIAMLDATTGRPLGLVPAGGDGFVRGVLRSMFRTRKLESRALSPRGLSQTDREAGFRLAREADGRLTLSDPRTGRRVDLGSFGPTNAAAFARLLAEAVARKEAP
jgi:putative photosynthetic complex assembly protein